LVTVCGDVKLTGRRRLQSRHADLPGPVVLEFLKWTPVKDGIEFSCPDGAGFGATRTTLSFDVILGEPEMLRDRPAVTQLRILTGLAEKAVHDLAPLA
jgi:hypothetical protein